MRAAGQFNVGSSTSVRDRRKPNRRPIHPKKEGGGLEGVADGCGASGGIADSEEQTTGTIETLPRIEEIVNVDFCEPSYGAEDQMSLIG